MIKSLLTIIPPGNSGSSVEARRLALVVIRTLARQENFKRLSSSSATSLLIQSNITSVAQIVFSSVRDMLIPIKLAAEAAFLEIFAVADYDSVRFDEYLSTVQDATVKRSMGDYFKRVALRLGGQIRERRESEGKKARRIEEEVTSEEEIEQRIQEEKEDVVEIWAVGRNDEGGLWKE